MSQSRDQLTGAVSLSGEIAGVNIATVRASTEKSLLSLTEKCRQVDLKGLETFNSQVLSLCLCLIRLGRQNGFTVHFINTPSRLFDMARVGGLEFIFEVDAA